MEKTLIIGFSVAMIVASFLIGWWAKRKVTSNKAFFGSTGMFGPLAVGLSSTAAVASAFALVGVPGIIYATGNPMTFWMLSSAAFTMAYIILGKKVRAMAEIGEVASLGDISDLRFNNNRLIKALLSVVIFGILTVYTAISGEVGGLLTQAFQGLVMVVAGVIMIVSFYAMTGGFGNVMQAVGSLKEAVGGDVTLFGYPGDDHNISANLSTALAHRPRRALRRAGGEPRRVGTAVGEHLLGRPVRPDRTSPRHG